MIDRGRRAGMPRCVQAVLDGDTSVRSPLLSDPETYWRDVRGALARLKAPVFEGLDEDDLPREVGVAALDPAHGVVALRLREEAAVHLDPRLHPRGERAAGVAAVARRAEVRERAPLLREEPVRHLGRDPDRREAGAEELAAETEA